MSFFVICRDDNTPDGTPGEYLLATRKTFATREEAGAYAGTIAPGREPIVAEAVHGMSYPVDPMNPDPLEFDFVTSDSGPETRYLVVDREGEEIATATTEDWAIAIAEALRNHRRALAAS